MNKENERQEIFEKEVSLLKEEGYEVKDLTIESLKANILGMALGFLLSIFFIFLYFFFNKSGEIVIDNKFIINYIFFLLVFALSIVIHELLHGLIWSIFAKNKFKSITFGILWKTLNPYCSCKEALNKKGYMVGVLMPLIILGIIPSLIAIFIHNGWLFIYSLSMIMGAGGDILIALLIFKTKVNKDALFFDHPTKGGLIIFEK